MAKARTEAALRQALSARMEPLSNADVEALCAVAECSPATFYRSAAVKAFRASLEAPKPKATPGTKETLTKLRGTAKLLANVVQVMALRIETQDRELAVLRQQANSNVTAFPDAKRRRR